MKTFQNISRWLSQAAVMIGLVLTTALAAAQTITYIHTDPWDTPVMATDAAGNVVWKENARPYGERLNNPAAEANNPIGFTGKPFDPSTGLSYMGARYYDPVLGRFMGVDAAPPSPDNLHSINRYAYANNNPYRFVDPDGNSPITFEQWAHSSAAISSYQQCGGNAACVQSNLTRMIQVRNELRGAGVDVADRSPLTANIGQAEFSQGNIRGALEATAATGIVALTQQGGAGGEKLLYRRGPGDSKALLESQAQAAEKALGIHGVSVSTSPVARAGQVVRCATCSSVEAAGFKVQQTGNDLSHHTVELPKPVTPEVARRWNALFK